jgi:hypothetical protein
MFQSQLGDYVLTEVQFVYPSKGRRFGTIGHSRTLAFLWRYSSSDDLWYNMESNRQWLLLLPILKEDSKTYCPVSTYSPSQHFPQLPFCVRMVHSQSNVCVCVRAHVSVCVYVYIHIFFTMWRCWLGE